MKNRYITRQEELVFEIQSLAHSININGGCVFVSNSGHVKGISVSVRESTNNWEDVLWEEPMLYYGEEIAHDYETFEFVVARLRTELERVLGSEF